VKLLHGPTKSGEMKTRHDSSAHTAAAVVLRAAVDTIAPFVSREHLPTAVMFYSDLDVRDEICDYVNKNGIDLVIVGRRSVESARQRSALCSDARMRMTLPCSRVCVASPLLRSHGAPPVRGQRVQLRAAPRGGSGARRQRGDAARGLHVKTEKRTHTRGEC
jgi:hypothetical protein